MLGDDDAPAHAHGDRVHRATAAVGVGTANGSHHFDSIDDASESRVLTIEMLTVLSTKADEELATR